MRVLGINGSPHRNGNTSVMLEWVLEEAAKEGLETEIFNLAGKPLAGCIDCRLCWAARDRRCGGSDDAFNEVLERILAADAVVIGAPTYFANIPANVKALIERVGMVNLANGGMLKRKVGAAAIVARRAGAIDAFTAINHLFLEAQMIVPGSSHWNMGYGHHDREVEADAEAQRTMRTLGQNIAWLLHKTGGTAGE